MKPSKSNLNSSPFWMDDPPAAVQRRDPSSLALWSLRSDLLAAAHRWPIPLICFLVGSLLGIALAMFVPAGFEAEVDLYVTYNGDAIYTNPDDYKNWQVSQLNELATSNEVLEETLRLLGQADPYWRELSLPEFRSHLQTLWRNTGRWRLIVTHPDPQRGQRAVETWAAVYVSEYRRAAEAGIQLLDLDRQIQALSAEQARAVARQSELEAATAKLASWQVILDDRQDANLSDLERWQLWLIVTEAANNTPAWYAIMEAFPPLQATKETYQAWILSFVAAINEEASLIQPQITALEDQKGQLTQQYQAVVDDNRGLSANLQVGRVEPASSSPRPARPVGLMALVGGVLGLLLWALVGMAVPLLQRS